MAHKRPKARVTRPGRPQPYARPAKPPPFPELQPFTNVGVKQQIEAGLKKMRAQLRQDISDLGSGDFAFNDELAAKLQGLASAVDLMMVMEAIRDGRSSFGDEGNLIFQQALAEAMLETDGEDIAEAMLEADGEGMGVLEPQTLDPYMFDAVRDVVLAAMRGCPAVPGATAETETPEAIEAAGRIVVALAEEGVFHQRVTDPDVGE